MTELEITFRKVAISILQKELNNFGNRWDYEGLGDRFYGQIINLDYDEYDLDEELYKHLNDYGFGIVSFILFLKS